jgi:MFS family permease
MVTLLSLMALLSSITAPINTLFPIFAHDIFKKDEFGFGLLQSAFGFGAMIAAFSFAKLFEQTKNKKRLLLLGITVSATSMLSFATTTSFIFALFALLIAGFSGGILFGLINSLIQLETPAALRGRVMSIYSFVLFVISSNFNFLIILSYSAYDTNLPFVY